ncbi:DUF6538 domain-containing protein [Hyphomonas atlantica]|uniref:DUF6538 domain-containing protein n=1 Tax=Hyphomonas atlantica TaxID=1280948 RepID=UPI0032B1B996
MKRVVGISYLEHRGRVWRCNRRVPRKFAHLNTRKRIKDSLGTTLLEQARSFFGVARQETGAACLIRLEGYR